MISLYITGIILIMLAVTLVECMMQQPLVGGRCTHFMPMIAMSV